MEGTGWPDGEPQRPKAKYKQTKRRLKLAVLTVHPWCFYCGCRITEDSSTVDHFVPVSLDDHESPNRKTNLVVACWWCNNRKGDEPPDEFMRRILRRNVANRLLE